MARAISGKCKILQTVSNKYLLAEWACTEFELEMLKESTSAQTNNAEKENNQLISKVCYTAMEIF